MVILHLVAPADVGGLERVVHALAIGQKHAGHDVHVAAVVTSADLERAFLQPLTAAGVATHTLRLGGRAYLRERGAVRLLCRALRPDVLHTHGYRPDVVDAGVARGLGIATVSTAHGFTGGGWRNRTYEWLQRQAFRRFDAVIAVSRPLAARLSMVAPDRLEVVPNAWYPAVAPLDRAAARRELRVPDDRFHIGWVGRLSPEKGPDVLVEALARLEGVPYAASFVGDGPERRRLETRATALGAAGRIVWAGARPEASRLFPGFDVFVLSSRTEGTPIVLFEAMAAGVPVVATHVGGVEDVVTPAEARLVPSEDPDALAQAVRDVWMDQGGAAARARAARARLEARFALGPWLERHEAIYDRVRRRPVKEGA